MQMIIVLNANKPKTVIKPQSTFNLNDHFEMFKRRAVFWALGMQGTVVS